MLGGRFSCEPLGEHHERAAFSSGNAALDRYSQQQAGQDVRRRLAAAFVLVDAAAGDDAGITGYYTLSATSVELTGLPPAVTRKLPRYPALPAVLLGRLAVDLRYRGQGLGELLLVDALRRALAQSAQIGAMAVLVDAQDETARAFYEHYGFQRFLDEEYRLFIPMATVAHLWAAD